MTAPGPSPASALACDYLTSGTACQARPARPYAVGLRCADHAPWALAGLPDPAAGRYCPPAVCWCGQCPPDRRPRDVGSLLADALGHLAPLAAPGRPQAPEPGAALSAPESAAGPGPARSQAAEPDRAAWTVQGRAVAVSAAGVLTVDGRPVAEGVTPADVTVYGRRLYVGGRPVADLAA